MKTAFPALPLPILYQDKWIVAVDKPAGQLVHPAEHPADGDLVTMKILRDQIGQQVYVIHRLDRPTSGVLLFATDLMVARALHAAFEKQEVRKIYWAVIDGHPGRQRWTCREPIRKSEKAVARAAKTEFELIERLDRQLGLVAAKPVTGRFHQIRRHLLYHGHPIVGDYRYSGIERCNELGSILGTGSRMLLQAKSLYFQHPVSRDCLCVEAPVDPFIEKCLAGTRLQRMRTDPSTDATDQSTRDQALQEGVQR